MLVQLAQQWRGEVLLFEKIEHARRAVMTRGVIRGPGESCPSTPICDVPPSRRPACPARPAQLFKLREPSRHHRPQRAVPRDAQEAVSLAELAVLVASAGNKGLFQSLFFQ